MPSIDCAEFVVNSKSSKGDNLFLVLSTPGKGARSSNVINPIRFE